MALTSEKSQKARAKIGECSTTIFDLKRELRNSGSKSEKGCVTHFSPTREHAKSRKGILVQAYKNISKYRNPRIMYYQKMNFTCTGMETQISRSQKNRR